MTTFNWAELMGQASEGFVALPSGPYPVQITKSEATTSGTGKLMFKLQYTVMGGEHNGRIIFDQVVLTPDNPNALRFFFENMESLGVAKEVFLQQPPVPPETIAQMLLGRQLTIELGQRQYNGRTVNDVKNYNAAGGMLQGGMPTGTPMPGVPGMVAGVPANLPGVAPLPAPVAPMPMAPPAPVAPAPVAPAPAYHADPATGQRWDGTQWLPPEQPAAPAAPPPPPPPPPAPVAPPAPPAPVAAPVAPPMPPAPVMPPPPVAAPPAPPVAPPMPPPPPAAPPAPVAEAPAPAAPPLPPPPPPPPAPAV